MPTRTANGDLHFEDAPLFLPNLTPAEIIQQGSFGGSYWRPIRLSVGLVADDYRDLPADWITGLNIDRYLTSPKYDPMVNKYGVACGQSLEQWDAAGWMNHTYDSRGWFQWYSRFYRGRRCEDDVRQISRWSKAAGEKGRFRRMALKRYLALGIKSVMSDDGRNEYDPDVGVVVHQTLHHWAVEIRQQMLDRTWESPGSVGV